MAPVVILSNVQLLYCIKSQLQCIPWLRMHHDHVLNITGAIFTGAVLNYVAIIGPFRPGPF